MTIYINLVEGTVSILFVCVENAGRSQMAEAFFKRYAPKGFGAASAGTNPCSEINPVVARAMSEVGIVLSQKPRLISDDVIEGSHLVIGMGCMGGDECPALSVDGVSDWGIEDPKGRTLEEVRAIRDEIELRVLGLIGQLEGNDA